MQSPQNAVGSLYGTRRTVLLMRIELDFCSAYEFELREYAVPIQLYVLAWSTSVVVNRAGTSVQTNILCFPTFIRVLLVLIPLPNEAKLHRSLAGLHKYERTGEQQHLAISNMLASSVDIPYVTRMTLSSVTQPQAVYTQAASQCATRSYVQHRSLC